jgi:hypothetical protein
MPSVKFWLLTRTPNQVLRLVMMKTIKKKKKKKKRRRRRKRTNNKNHSKNKNNNYPQQNNNHMLQQAVEDYQLGDCLKEGTPTFILLSFQPKV